MLERTLSMVTCVSCVEQKGYGEKSFIAALSEVVMDRRAGSKSESAGTNLFHCV